ncbi:hypothetical protein ACQZOR_09775 [Lactobacillus delbrueckii subsp. bulgaricus]|uniref:hypothetical protein n=1 Tax=Lactobacillus delbrueckii TaxID=1584 RepID=UPI003D2ED3E5
MSSPLKFHPSWPIKPGNGTFSPLSILTLYLYFLFKKEIRYISQEQTVITEDGHFFWSTILCMILVVA